MIEANRRARALDTEDSAVLARLQYVSTIGIDSRGLEEAPADKTGCAKCFERRAIYSPFCSPTKKLI